MSGRKVLRVAGLSFVSTESGDVVVRMHDALGEVFAVASMRPPTADIAFKAFEAARLSAAIRRPAPCRPSEQVH